MNSDGAEYEFLISNKRHQKIVYCSNSIPISILFLSWNDGCKSVEINPIPKDSPEEIHLAKHADETYNG